MVTPKPTHFRSKKDSKAVKVAQRQYPTPVFLPIPPVSILVSQVKDLPYEDLRAGIFQATETLASFN